MAPPPFAMHSPPPPPGLLFPNMFPPLPPPPPPPPNYLLRNLRNNGFAFPVLPRIPRAQHSCRPKKIINICDPQTGQDITEEILSSVNKKNAPDKSYPLKKVSPPFRPHRRPPLPVSSPLPIPLGFIRKTPPPPLIMKCVPDPEFLWPKDDIRWRNPNGLSPFFGSCSWPPNSANLPDEDGAIREPRKRYQSVSVNKKNIVNYNRDVLLSLRYHPLALEKPAGLPDLEVIKKEVKQPEKTSEKVCDNGAQTVLARAAFKSQSKNAIGFKKAGYSNHKLKPSTLKKDNISGEEMKSKALTLKSPVTLDRGDGKEVGEVNNLIEKISNLAIG